MKWDCGIFLWAGRSARRYGAALILLAAVAPVAAGRGGQGFRGETGAGSLWYVSAEVGDDDNPGSQELPFATIQRGIVAANGGDTVLLAAGVYTGEGNRDLDFMGKAITVRSLNGYRSACVVDAEGSPAEPRVGFRFRGGETCAAVLEGITVTGGYPAGIWCGDAGVAVATAPTLRDLDLQQNPGAGLLVEGLWGYSEVRPRIVASLVRDNGGAGVRMAYCGVAAIDSCEVSGNGGTGVELLSDSWWGWDDPFLIADTQILDNAGAGVSFQGSLEDLVQVLRCRVGGNGGWGVASSGEAAGLVFANSVSERNTLGGVRGSVMDHLIQIDDSDIVDNGGPGVRVDVLSWYFGVSGSRIVGNAGDGVMASFTGLRADLVEPRGDRLRTRAITDCVISDNQGFGIRLGGGLAVASFTVSSCLVSRNETGGIQLGGQQYHVSDGYVLQFLTIADNGGHGVEHGSVNLPCAISQTIIAGNTGQALTVAQPELLEIVCSNFHGNAGGDWAPPLQEWLGVAGNIAADPLFCHPTGGDYTMSTTSPCLPGNHPDGAACGQIGVYGMGCVLAPQWIAITDVGNDQGRRVRLTWSRAWHDASGYPLPVTGYGIYRRQDEYKQETPAPADPGIGAGAGQGASLRLEGWDYLATVPSRGDEVYQYIAETLCDSTIAHGMCWTAFFISAMTADPFTFYDSPVDSGYSLDNLAPSAPTNVRRIPPSYLAWDPVGDADLAYYRVFAGEAVLETTGTLLDVGELWDGPLAVAAVDFAGNQSELSGDPTAVGGSLVPARHALRQNVPNPFNPQTAIAFDLPRASAVRLRVFDPRGRAVRTLLAGGVLGAGRHEVIWNGRDDLGCHVAAGVYLYRLEAGAYAASRRMALLK